MISFKSIKAGFDLKEPAFFRSWLKNILEREGNYKVGDIHYIFCDDEYLLKINKKYLNHNTFTDIITFPVVLNERIISGEVFISIDRIIENKNVYQVTLHDELSRVMVHGLLHLLGYVDQTKDEKAIMTAKEDYYLSLQPKKLH
jgi:rRNA maturation RNase YbeY